MFYIKMTTQCNLFDLGFGVYDGNGNNTEFIHSDNEHRIFEAIRIVKNTVRNNWYSHRIQPLFIKGAKYYWVTTSSPGHLRRLTIEEGPITDNVANLRYNYFQSREAAEELKVKMEKVIKRLP